MIPSGLTAYFVPYFFHFKAPAGTSRGVLHERKSWFLVIHSQNYPVVKGIGECAPLKGLSVDDRPDFEDFLRKVCRDINRINFWLNEGLKDFPSIKFGLETALLDFCNSGKRILYPSPFTEGKDSIRINGLIWMGELEEMKRQADEKIKTGFRCIKIKIGAIDFESELSLLRHIRESYPSEIELRVDANGAFSMEDVWSKLERLAEYEIHSIEQPVKPGQWKQMAEVCRQSPVPVALDEELIGIKDKEQKRELLSEIRPQYIILKPTLIGGFSEALEWINLAKAYRTGWWITSALESNIGLNAIAQWTFTLNNKMAQGLGTGQLYADNFSCPLRIGGDTLSYNSADGWKLPAELC